MDVKDIDGDNGIWAARAQRGRLNMVVHRENVQYYLLAHPLRAFVVVIVSFRLRCLCYLPSLRVPIAP